MVHSEEICSALLGGMMVTEQAGWLVGLFICIPLYVEEVANLNDQRNPSEVSAS